MNTLSIDPNEPDRLMTVEEVATMLRLEPAFVRRQIHDEPGSYAPAPSVVLHPDHPDEDLGSWPLYRRSAVLDWLQDQELDYREEHEDEDEEGELRAAAAEEEEDDEVLDEGKEDETES